MTRKLSKLLTEHYNLNSFIVAPHLTSLFVCAGRGWAGDNANAMLLTTKSENVPVSRHWHKDIISTFQRVKSVSLSLCSFQFEFYLTVILMCSKQQINIHTSAMIMKKSASLCIHEFTLMKIRISLNNP